MGTRIDRIHFYYKELIYRNVKGRKVFTFFVLTYVVYALMLLVTIPKVMGFSDGMKIFDMMPFGYSSEYANTLLNSLGEEGRHVYLFLQIPLDMIYPFLFGVGNSLLLAFFLNKLRHLKTPYIYLCLLPLLAGSFDYLENFGVSAMLFSFPDISDLLIQTTSMFSVAKSLLTSIYFVVLIVVLLAFLWNRIFLMKRQ